MIKDYFFNCSLAVGLAVFIHYVAINQIILISRSLTETWQHDTIAPKSHLEIISTSQPTPHRHSYGCFTAVKLS